MFLCLILFCLFNSLCNYLTSCTHLIMALQYIGLSSHVVGPVYGDFGLWPFWFAPASVCSLSFWGRFVLPVCGRFSLWPFRFVAFSVCGRFGCGLFGLWLLWPVTVKVICLYTLGSITYSFHMVQDSENNWLTKYIRYMAPSNDEQCTAPQARKIFRSFSVLIELNSYPNRETNAHTNCSL